MRGRLLIGLAISSLHACAVAQTGAHAVSEAVVLESLASRSGVSVREIGELVKNCDASQQSMYFCAYRDLVRSELILDQVIASRHEAECAARLQREKVRWQSDRDDICKKIAAEQWSGGSMEPTARLICMTSETQRISGELGSPLRCEF